MKYGLRMRIGLELAVTTVVLFLQVTYYLAAKSLRKAIDICKKRLFLPQNFSEIELYLE